MTRTLSIDEAAEALKVHASTVADCIAHRGLPAVKVGRAWVLVEADVIEWLRAQYAPSKKETKPCDSTNAAKVASGN